MWLTHFIEYIFKALKSVRKKFIQSLSESNNQKAGVGFIWYLGFDMAHIADLGVTFANE